MPGIRYSIEVQIVFLLCGASYAGVWGVLTSLPEKFLKNAMICYDSWFLTKVITQWKHFKLLDTQHNSLIVIFICHFHDHAWDKIHITLWITEIRYMQVIKHILINDKIRQLCMCCGDTKTYPLCLSCYAYKLPLQFRGHLNSALGPQLHVWLWRWWWHMASLTKIIYWIMKKDQMWLLET